MHEVGAGELHAAPNCVPEAAALDERGRLSQPHQREPDECDEVAARNDPEARNPDRQKGDTTDGERDEEVPAAMDRPHESDRARVRRTHHRRPEDEHEDGARRIGELGRADAEQ